MINKILAKMNDIGIMVKFAALVVLGCLSIVVGFTGLRN